MLLLTSVYARVHLRVWQSHERACEFWKDFALKYEDASRLAASLPLLQPTPLCSHCAGGRGAGFSQCPFVIPPLGEHYTVQWAQEDQHRVRVDMR